MKIHRVEPFPVIEKNALATKIMLPHQLDDTIIAGHHVITRRGRDVFTAMRIARLAIDDSLFTSGILLLGGSTNLMHKGTYFEGDLSGITASQLPFWFQHFYKPGKKIAQNTDWNKKNR